MNTHYDIFVRLGELREQICDKDEADQLIIEVRDALRDVAKSDVDLPQLIELRMEIAALSDKVDDFSTQLIRVEKNLMDVDVDVDRLKQPHLDHFFGTDGTTVYGEDE